MLQRYIPWRVKEDKSLVCLENKLVPLCSVLRRMCAEHGLVDVQILDHEYKPKMRPVPCLHGPLAFRVASQTVFHPL